MAPFLLYFAISSLLISCRAEYLPSLQWSNSQENVTCEVLVNIFATATSDFVNCSIQFAHPVTFCESCVAKYLDVLESYKGLKESSESDVPCISKYVDQDRLQIIKNIYGVVVNLWEEAKCDGCFTSENGTLTRSISNQTLHFRKLYRELNTCLNKTASQELVCDDCLDIYSNLTHFYWSVSNKNEKIGVCMDIVDLMNTTWSSWSKECCTYRQKNEYIFIICSVIISLLPIIFYFATYIFAEKSQTVILPQTRLMESVQRHRH